MYGANGLEIPSNYKTSTLFRAIANDILDVMKTTTSREPFGSYLHVFGGADPATGEYIISFPRIYAAPKGDFLDDQIIQEITLIPGHTNDGTDPEV
jgi:hypothetical protein